MSFNAVEYFTNSRYFMTGHGTQGNYPNVCKYAIEYPSDTTPYGCNICHAGVVNGHYQGLIGIYSSLWVKRAADYGAALSYWNYILDPDVSPWRQILKTKDGRVAKIIYDNKDRPIAFYLPIDAESSYQLVCNLCVASRTSYEKPENIRTFAYGLSHGLTVHEALLFSSYCLVEDDKLKEVTQHSHFPFNLSYNIKLSSFKDGAPQLTPRKMQGNREYYSPCINEIWQDPKGGRPVLYSILKNAQTYTGVFAKRFQYTYGSLEFKGSIVSDAKKAIELIVAHRGEL